MRELRVTAAVIGAASVLAFGAVCAISAVMESPDFTDRDRCEAVTLVVAVGQAFPCDPLHGQRVDVIGGTAEDCDRAGGVWSRSASAPPVCEGVDF